MQPDDVYFQTCTRNALTSTLLCVMESQFDFSTPSCCTTATRADSSLFRTYAQLLRVQRILCVAVPFDTFFAHPSVFTRAVRS